MSSCYHCADQCVEEIQFDEKVFCCSGCKTVYEILEMSDMSSLYELEENPSIRPSGAQIGKYDFLQLEEIQEKLLDFKEGNISKIRFHLPQIHCSSCLWLLERLHKLQEGIIQSQVNFAKKEAIVTFDHEKIDLTKVAELLATLGYPPPITLNELSGNPTKKFNRKLIVRIGVAGFCFGNIMLLSFPEYLGISESDENFQSLFNYLNLVLALPVLLYSARGYIVSAFKSLSNRSINIDVPITIGIFALFSRSLFEVLSGSGAGYFDSFAGLIFFLLIGRWFQQKTYDAINFERDYKSFFPIAVTKLTGSDEHITPLSEVGIGDRILIRNQELIPADSELVKGRARIDYSFVSGESRHFSKDVGEQIYAGGRQDGSAIEVVIRKNVDNGYLTSLWNNPIFSKQKVGSKIADHVAKYFTIVLILIAFFAGLYWSFADPSQIAFVVTSILIVACPCAIALSVPFTYGNGIRLLGRRNFFLKSADVIERMSEVTDIVFDKTGTITQSDEMHCSWQGDVLTEEQKTIIFGLVRNSNHPLSREITKFLEGVQRQEYEVKEISGKGLRAIINGSKWTIGSSDFVGTADVVTETRVYVSCDNELLGFYRFSNQYLEGVEELFKELKQDFRLHILSGDNDSERDRLEVLLPYETHLNFNQSPESKLEYVKRLQESGATVMMVGDGLNDAGALRQSDVGVAAVSDLHSFSPSSDGIITTQKLKKLASYMEFSKYSKRIVKISYIFSVVYNLIGLGFAVQGLLTPLVAAILMPLSSISIIVLVTILVNKRERRLGVS